MYRYQIGIRDTDPDFIWTMMAQFNQAVTESVLTHSSSPSSPRQLPRTRPRCSGWFAPQRRWLAVPCPPSVDSKAPRRLQRIMADNSHLRHSLFHFQNKVAASSPKHSRSSSAFAWAQKNMAIKVNVKVPTRGITEASQNTNVKR